MSIDNPVRAIASPLISLPLTPLKSLMGLVSGDAATADVPLFAAAPIAAAATPNALSSAADAGPSRAKAARQDALLSEVGKMGVYAWAQGQKFQGLEGEIRAQVLADRDLDEAALAKLDPSAKTSAETSLQEEIARHVKEAMQTRLEGQAKLAARAGQPPAPMLIDIEV